MRCSVVIPVYNKAPFLKACFESVFAQTFADFEVIAVDDASTDGSLGILRSMTDARLRIIELPANLGPAGAAQRGMDAAIGEYIVRMDADDIMLPGRIARQITFMDDNREVGASGTSVQLLGRADMTRVMLTDDEDLRAAVLFRIPVLQPTSIYRRSVLLEHGVRMDDQWPRSGEDWLFQLRLLKITRFANMVEPLLLYREGEQGISFGRDRSADLRMLYTAICDTYGWPVEEQDLRSHFHAMNHFPEPLVAEDVRAMKRYLSRLAERNDRSKAFPVEAFKRALDGVWDAWAYQMPRFGLSTTLAYFANDHRRSLAKIRYQVSTLLSGKVYRAR